MSKRIQTVARSSHPTFEALEQRRLLAATVLADLASGTIPTHAYTSGWYDGKVVFQAYDRTSTSKFEYRLFITDGTPAGTRPLIDRPIDQFLAALDSVGSIATIEFKGGAYTAEQLPIPGTYTQEIIRLSRRDLATGEVAEIFSRQASTGTPAISLAVAHGKLYFHSRAGFFLLDGETNDFRTFDVAGDLPDFPVIATSINGIYAIDDQLYAHTYAYTRQDTRFREIQIDPEGKMRGIDDEVEVGGKRFFVKTTVKELRMGSDEDSILIRDGVHPNLLAHNGFVYFITHNNDRFEVWKTDGTTAGTKRVEDYGPFGSSGFNSSYAPRLMGIANGQLIINGPNPRAIPISGVEPRADGTLVIRGSPQADILTISRNVNSDGDFLQVVLNGEEFNFSNHQIARIRIDVAAGNDRVITDESNGAITTPVSVLGGAGNDIIKGGSGRDTLYGGDGDDSLYGGGGNDYLWGQNGNDRLNGGGGRDILWGGSGRDTFVSSILSERRDQSLDDILY